MKDSKQITPSTVFKYARGMYIKNKILETTTGEDIEIPGRESFTHIQFRRFAGCPIRNLHLKNFARQQHQIKRMGIREVIVFQSSRKELLKYTSVFPFDVVADPKKQLYRDYGVEASPRGITKTRQRFYLSSEV